MIPTNRSYLKQAYKSFNQRPITYLLDVNSLQLLYVGKFYTAWLDFKLKNRPLAALI